MSESYAKVFETLLTSTVWEESSQTRCVWVTLMLRADRHGMVQSSVPGLARLANVSLEDCEKALAAFLAPDKYSRTTDFEGRRIETVDGGWRLLNHPKYRKKLGAEERREKQATWVAEKRAKRQKTTGVDNDDKSEMSAGVDKCRDITDADADAELTTTTEARNTHHATNSAGEGVCVSSFEPADDAEAPKPRQELMPVAQAAIELRRRGGRITSSNPDLHAAIAEGVTVQDLAEMADTYPDKPAGYIVAACRRQLAEKANPLGGNGARAGPGASSIRDDFSEAKYEGTPDDKLPASIRAAKRAARDSSGAGAG